MSWNVSFYFGVGLSPSGRGDYYIDYGVILSAFRDSISSCSHYLNLYSNRFGEMKRIASMHRDLRQMEMGLNEFLQKNAALSQQRKSPPTAQYAKAIETQSKKLTNTMGQFSNYCSSHRLVMDENAQNNAFGHLSDLKKNLTGMMGIIIEDYTHDPRLHTNYIYRGNVELLRQTFLNLSSEFETGEREYCRVYSRLGNIQERFFPMLQYGRVLGAETSGEHYRKMILTHRQNREKDAVKVCEVYAIKRIEIMRSYERGEKIAPDQLARWIIIHVPAKIANQIVPLLNEEQETIRKFVEEKKRWLAYNQQDFSSLADNHQRGLKSEKRVQAIGNQFYSSSQQTDALKLRFPCYSSQVQEWMGNTESQAATLDQLSLFDSQTVFNINQKKNRANADFAFGMNQFQPLYSELEKIKKEQSEAIKALENIQASNLSIQGTLQHQSASGGVNFPGVKQFDALLGRFQSHLNYLDSLSQKRKEIEEKIEQQNQSLYSQMQSNAQTIGQEEWKLAQSRMSLFNTMGELQQQLDHNKKFRWKIEQSNSEYAKLYREQKWFNRSLREEEKAGKTLERQGNDSRIDVQIDHRTYKNTQEMGLLQTNYYSKHITTILLEYPQKEYWESMQAFQLSRPASSTSTPFQQYHLDRLKADSKSLTFASDPSSSPPQTPYDILVAASRKKSAEKKALPSSQNSEETTSERNKKKYAVPPFFYGQQFLGYDPLRGYREWEEKRQQLILGAMPLRAEQLAKQYGDTFEKKWSSWFSQSKHGNVSYFAAKEVCEQRRSETWLDIVSKGAGLLGDLCEMGEGKPSDFPSDVESLVGYCHRIGSMDGQELNAFYNDVMDIKKTKPQQKEAYIRELLKSYPWQIEQSKSNYELLAAHAITGDGKSYRPDVVQKFLEDGLIDQSEANYFFESCKPVGKNSTFSTYDPFCYHNMFNSISSEQKSSMDQAIIPVQQFYQSQQKPLKEVFSELALGVVDIPLEIGKGVGSLLYNVVSPAIDTVEWIKATPEQRRQWEEESKREREERFEQTKWAWSHPIESTGNCIKNTFFPHISKLASEKSVRAIPGAIFDLFLLRSMVKQGLTKPTTVLEVPRVSRGTFKKPSFVVDVSTDVAALQEGRLIPHSSKPFSGLIKPGSKFFQLTVQEVEQFMEWLSHPFNPCSDLAIEGAGFYSQTTQGSRSIVQPGLIAEKTTTRMLSKGSSNNPCKIQPIDARQASKVNKGMLEKAKEFFEGKPNSELSNYSYELNPKHAKGALCHGSPMDLDDITAQFILQHGEKAGKKVINVFDGKLYIFQEHLPNTNVWHGYIAGKKDLNNISNALKELEKRGIIRSAKRIQQGKDITFV